MSCVRLSQQEAQPLTPCSHLLWWALLAASPGSWAQEQLLEWLLSLLSRWLAAA